MSYDSDINAEVISDSLNLRDWLRWDVLKGLTYDQTVTATTTGSYSNWQIATETDARMFTQAIVPADRVNSCTSASYSAGCWSDRDTTRSYHQLLGDSFHTGDRYDYAFFASQVSGRAGYLRAEQIGSLAFVSKENNFASFQTASGFADPNQGIGWLLFRNHPKSLVLASVNEPSSLIMILMSALGLGAYRKKTQAVRRIRYNK
jgi:hypothetical protein